MSVVQHDEVTGCSRVVVKGAPESVLPRVVSIAAADEARKAVEELAGGAMRVLAVAVRDLSADPDLPSRRENAESGLTLLGLVGLYDPPRSEVEAAVRRCHEAGVRVHIVTGDTGPGQGGGGSARSGAGVRVSGS